MIFKMNKIHPVNHENLINPCLTETESIGTEDEAAHAGDAVGDTARGA